MPCPGKPRKVNDNIQKLLSKGVIRKAMPESGEFISSIFLTPKKDGSHRMILNLKNLNEYILHYDFKTNTIQTSLKLMHSGCFMASVDLKDAYYSVPVASEHLKFLKFVWKQEYYRFTCLPNGLAGEPRLFTKLSKPVLSYIRSLGHICMGQIDDSSHWL